MFLINNELKTLKNMFLINLFFRKSEFNISYVFN